MIAQELIAFAKQKPGELNYASVGVGSGTHLAAVLFTLAAGVQMTHVPYKGIQQVAPDLVAGSVHLTFNALGPLAQFVQSARVKMLATTAARRLPQLADVPTIAETIPGFTAMAWLALLAPTGTPEPIIRKANADLNHVFALPEIAHRLHEIGTYARLLSPAETAEFISSEQRVWIPLVRQVGVAR